MASPHFLRKVIACMFSVAVSTQAFGGVIWNEGVNGDLSGNRLAPTSLTASFGNNTIIGTTGGGDREYFTFTAPDNFTAMLLDTYVSSDAVSFIAIQSGNTFTEPFSGTNVANLLGYTHFGSGGAGVGSNLLTSMGAGGGSIGFTPPLPAGSYVFWVQQLGSTTDYQFNIQVVPEPSMYALILGVFIAGLTAVWRRSRRP